MKKNSDVDLIAQMLVKQRKLSALLTDRRNLDCNCRRINALKSEIQQLQQQVKRR